MRAGQRLGSAGEGLVGHPGRVGAFAQLIDSEVLVLAEVAFEPPNLAVALEREDVCRDAIEEPPIVGDDDGAAGVALQRVFEGAQGVDIEIVGRLIEEEDVASGLERLRQVDAVAFATGKKADLLLLI